MFNVSRALPLANSLGRFAGKKVHRTFFLIPLTPHLPQIAQGQNQKWFCPLFVPFSVNYEMMSDSSDLKGDIGRQWLALYGVKYEFGRPILADSLKYVKGASKLPDGYVVGIQKLQVSVQCSMQDLSHLAAGSA